MSKRRYLALFHEEMADYITRISTLVAKAASNSMDAMTAHEELCRIIHSIAGTAGSLELADIADLAANLEDCLRSSGPGYSLELVQLILDMSTYCAGRLAKMVASLKSSASSPAGVPAEGEGFALTGDIDPSTAEQEAYTQLSTRLATMMAGSNSESALSAGASNRIDSRFTGLSAEDLAILRAFDESEPDAIPSPQPTGEQSMDISRDGPLPHEVEYFMLEASETLVAMHEALTQLGHGVSDTGTALTIQRLAHKIKGAAGTVGYTVVAGIAHRLEDLMALIRRRALTFTPAVIEATLHGLTILEADLHHILSKHSEDSALLEQLSTEYDALLQAATLSDEASAAPAFAIQPSGTGTQLPLLGASTERYLHVDARRLDQLMGRLAELTANRAGLVQIGQDIQTLLLELRMALQRLQALHSRFAGYNPRASFPPSSSAQTLPPSVHTMTMHTAGSGNTMASLSTPQTQPAGATRVPTSQLVARVLATRERASPAQQATRLTRPAVPPNDHPSPSAWRSRLPQLAGAGTPSQQTASERWDSLELDQYTDFDQLVRAFAEVIADVAAVSTGLQEVFKREERLLQVHRHLTSQVQRELMELRLIPISQVVPRLQRAAHVYAAELGKSIQFVVQGEHTQIDREVVEAIVDPLIQLVRNSIAHGIEPAEDRLESGKPETGLIWLRAYYLGNEVVLEFGDDGRGINPHLLAAAAVASGLLSPEEAQRLTPQEMLELVFVPGISTSEEVTALAGRGIGMDLVRNTVEQLRGSIRVQSDIGRGTVFRLRMPISLSILQVLQVQIRDLTYAVPLLSVERICAVSPDDLILATGASALSASPPAANKLGLPLPYHLKLKEDGETLEVPAFWLSELLGMTPPATAEDMHTRAEHAHGLILPVQRRRVAILVDRVSGEQEIVVKQLPPYLRRPGVRGASIMSADEVLLVLDIPELAAAALRGTGAVADVSPRARPPLPSPGPAILVADDSPSIRRSLKQILTRAGYEVLLARDGMEALEQMVRQLPRILLLDIEMPRLDGIELLSIMRHHEQFAAVPVIILTSRGAEKHRRYLHALGASRYLVKPCPQDELLAAIAAQLAGGTPLSSEGKS